MNMYEIIFIVTVIVGMILGYYFNFIYHIKS